MILSMCHNLVQGSPDVLAAELIWTTTMRLRRRVTNASFVAEKITISMNIPLKIMGFSCSILTILSMDPTGPYLVIQSLQFNSTWTYLHLPTWRIKRCSWKQNVGPFCQCHEGCTGKVRPWWHSHLLLHLWWHCSLVRFFRGWSWEECHRFLSKTWN